jgi:hypothetical protein
LPFPEEANRQRIWERVFPVPGEGQAPLVEWPDYAFLARLPLTGGSIHNTALNAAFLAAQAGTPVTMPLLLTAAHGELRKLERPTSQANFRPPPAVRARAAAWSCLLADAAEQQGVEFDYERLAWWDLDEKEMEQVAARAARKARAAGSPLLMQWLVEAAGLPASPAQPAGDGNASSPQTIGSLTTASSDNDGEP